LLTFAHAIIPFLTNNELNRIWQVIKQSPCYAQLPYADQQWIELLHALSIENADQISSISQHLLNSPTPLTASQGEFLVSSALLGELLLNNSSAAKQIWQQYHAKYQLDPQSSLLLRLVTAHNGLI